MTPLLCNEPTLKMRRLFCCEKCLQSFATALKIQVKTDEDKTNFNRNKFFAVEERTGQLFAIVCYNDRKRQFLTVLDSPKKGSPEMTVQCPE